MKQPGWSFGLSLGGRDSADFLDLCRFTRQQWLLSDPKSPSRLREVLLACNSLLKRACRSNTQKERE
ncbi:MAG: hypothetical protein C5B49_12730 [Bdellovibrio sp.]|nr:MAG: hypothetical protein C5B49_12730 [Bdellovibrio sp.]